MLATPGPVSGAKANGPLPPIPLAATLPEPADAEPTRSATRSVGGALARTVVGATAVAASTPFTPTVSGPAQTSVERTSGRVTAVHASGRYVAHRAGAARAAGLANIETNVCDVQALSLPSGSVDGAALSVTGLLGHDWLHRHGHEGWLDVCLAGFLFGLLGTALMARHDARRRHSG